MVGNFEAKCIRNEQNKSETVKTPNVFDFQSTFRVLCGLSNPQKTNT